MSEKKQMRYVAYYAATQEYYEFATIEEAKNFLVDYDNQDGVSEQTVKGENYIAEIKLVSKCEVSKTRQDWDEEAEGVAWPYDYDTILDIQYAPIKNDEGDEDDLIQKHNESNQATYDDMSENPQV